MLHHRTIQDAVAAGNLLAETLRTKQLTIEHLRDVRRRRELPTQITQRFQVAIQNRIISCVLKRGGILKPPLFIRTRFPVLRRIPALVGMGIQPRIDYRKAPAGAIKAVQAVQQYVK